MERLTGYSPGEILGKPMVWRGLIHPDDFRSVQETIRFCVRRRDPILRMEYRIVRKDGEFRWINDRRQMIYDEGGKLLCVDGLCLDISDQKKAEQDLRAAFERAEGERGGAAIEEERRRLAAAVEYAADAIMVTDAEWVVQYVNPAFEKVTGYAKEEILGRNPYILAADGENIRVYLGIEDKIRSGSPWKGRLKNKRKDGILLEQDTVIYPIRDPDGKIANHVVASRDITREVLLEKQARTAQQMEAVGTLAGGIAHDFNNALTGIIGFADLLRMRLEKEPKLQRDVDEILKCAERASTLTRQLLAFARRQVIEPVSLGLNTVVGDLSRLMKKVSGEQIEVRTRLTEGIPPDLRGPGPARAGPPEPVPELPGRDARRRGVPRLDGRGRMGGREGGGSCRHARGEIRSPGGRGQRLRDGRRDAKARVRAVLHDEGSRQGDGARSFDGLRDREAERGVRLPRHPPWGRDDVPDLLPRVGGGLRREGGREEEKKEGGRQRRDGDDPAGGG